MSPGPIVQLDCRAAHNNRQHGTSELFEAAAPPRPELVIRRGKSLVLRVSCKGNVKSDRVVFAFTQACPNAVTVPNAAAIFVPVRGTHLYPRRNGAVKIRRSGNVIDYEVMLSVSAPVGLYNVSVHYVIFGKLAWQCTCYEIMHLLFNASCSDDPAVMPDATQRTGYLTADEGVIFTGSNPQENSAALWHFGQFELVSTRIAHDLLADVDPAIRSDPGMTARALTIAVSRRLTYGDSEWSGSTSILDAALRYGTSSGVQCYMFAGVLASLLRSLGLCARCITNYQSAIDHNGNLTIDRYLLDDGSEKEVHGEKVWNFHAWTEVWCARADLHPDMNGWQAVDATYGSGPAPVAAIRRGLLHVPFDVSKFYTETNADMIVHYGRVDRRTGKFVETRRAVKSGATGLALMTTAPNNPYAPYDVTHHYKHKKHD